MNKFNISVNDVPKSNNVLKSIEKQEYIRYVTGSYLPVNIKNILLRNKFIQQVFNKSVDDYKRDDYTISSLPAISIYENSNNIISREGRKAGTIRMDVYLSIKIARRNTSTLFGVIFDLIKWVIMAPTFFQELCLEIIPLPEKSAPFYQDILAYRDGTVNPLIDFARAGIATTLPTKIDLNDIKDVWKGTIDIPYQIDQLNGYALLEAIGVSWDYDFNEIVYPYLEEFSVITSAEEAVNPITTGN